jgi:signal peptidase I
MTANDSSAHALRHSLHSGSAASGPLLHGPAEALLSLLRSALVALFAVTFIVQPVVIPSESMEPTLLVGDFLLVNRIALAPAGPWHRLLACASPARQQIVTFRSPLHPQEYLIKRIVAIPGDHLRIVNNHVWIDGRPLAEPYLAPESGYSQAALADFPAAEYTDPRMDVVWWRTMQPLVHNGELTVPAGQYFVLGDNRAHSLDSRYWGFVDRDRIVASPVLIYLSLRRPSIPERPTVPVMVSGPADDRLGHDGGLSARIFDAVRWTRLFHVVR